jgi:DNA-binding MarR family transcriptional regulator
MNEDYRRSIGGDTDRIVPPHKEAQQSAGSSGRGATRSFEQILNEFRTELLKLSPTLTYLTTAEFVEQLIAERDLRSCYLNLEFGEPGWDMLIDLYRAAERNQKISVSSLTLASRVPATTALRQIARLKAQALIDTEADPFDKRRAYVYLKPAAREALNGYLSRLALLRNINLMSSHLIGKAAN